MGNMPDSKGRSRPREPSITSSEEDGSGEIEKEPGGLSSTNTGTTKDLGAMDEHTRPEALIDGVETSSRGIGYECTPSRKELAAERVPTIQQPKSDVIPTAAIVQPTPVEDPKDISPEPPITKITLSELDIPRIIYNPKLRHDVNFDPNLHFRPNLDGETGRRKAQKAIDFWNRHRTEIEEFMIDPASFESKLAGKDWSLPSVLKAIGEILGTLVPPEDRPGVEDILNVQLLMQQFRRGIVDLDGLGTWLARTLKSHCAPMRDDWVDDTVKLLKAGGRNRDIDSLVQGLQSLLGVLEAMRLDVANHQIRCLRPLLIQDTVEFEQTFFMKKISICKVDVGEAYAWFETAKSNCEVDAPHANFSQDMLAFFSGFANMLLPSRIRAYVPDTFMFDEERIVKLRSDISNLVNLEVCARLLESFPAIGYGPRTRNTTTVSTPLRFALRPESPAPQISATTNPTTKASNILPINSHRELQASHLPKLLTGLHRNARVDEPTEKSDCESDEEDSGTEKSAPSTRRTSFSSINSRSIASSLSRSGISSVSPVDSKLRQSILAIVEDASGSDRWQQSSADIALELLRSTPNHEEVSRLESQLKLHLCNPSSSVFQISESHILADLCALLSELAARYAPLNPKQLFEVATSRRHLPHQAQVLRHALSDIAKQMAHVGILHWRVWAPLAYLINPDDIGHVTDATAPDSPRNGDSSGSLADKNRRPASKGENPNAESTSTGS